MVGGVYVVSVAQSADIIIIVEQQQQQRTCSYPLSLSTGLLRLSPHHPPEPASPHPVNYCLWVDITYLSPSISMVHVGRHCCRAGFNTYIACCCCCSWLGNQIYFVLLSTREHAADNVMKGIIALLFISTRE